MHNDIQKILKYRAWAICDSFLAVINIVYRLGGICLLLDQVQIKCFCVTGTWVESPL